MINKRGGKVGPQRAKRQRFPYEPRVIGGKLLMPAELQAIPIGGCGLISDIAKPRLLTRAATSPANGRL
jgi:hypothetical protein